MTDRCEPPAELRGVDGPWWLSEDGPDGPIDIYWWESGASGNGHWRNRLGEIETSADLGASGCVCLSPAPSPEALAALVDAARLAKKQIEDLDDELNQPNHVVYGWHLNGAGENATSFFDTNDHGALDALTAALIPFPEQKDAPDAE